MTKTMFAEIPVDELTNVTGGQDVANGVWAQGKDTRNFWQRNAPGFLGGQPEPPRPGVCFDGGALSGVRGNRRFTSQSLDRVQQLGRQLPYPSGE